MSAGDAAPGRLAAVLAGLCPRCRKGRVFPPVTRHPVGMHRTCPECGLEFEREPGYFLGAMYLSYGLGIAVLAAPVTTMLVRGSPPPAILAVAAVTLAVLSPWLFRASRVLWLHFDDHFDPR